MHAAGVVCDEKPTAAEDVDEGGEVGRASEVFNAIGRKAGGDLVRDGEVFGGAEQLEAFRGKGGNQGAPVRDRPALLRRVFRAADERDGWRRGGWRSGGERL